MSSEYQMIGKRGISDRVRQKSRPVQLRLVHSVAEDEQTTENLEDHDVQVAYMVQALTPLEWMILESRIELNDASVTQVERDALASRGR